ncbi:hypothetical protein ACFY36_35790 [Actinoplanes sp. NPDC000266]
MLNLIGLVIGKALATREGVPEDEQAPFALLGAAAPSPLVGAVLVSSALDQRADRPGGGDKGGSDGKSGGKGAGTRSGDGNQPTAASKTATEAG